MLDVVLPAPIDARSEAITLHETLPRWQCHKVVGGMRIVAISAIVGTTDIQLVLQDERIVVQPVIVDRSWYEKHKPEIDGYFVLYDDGYYSYSPAAAFEDGYHRV